MVISERFDLAPERVRAVIDDRSEFTEYVLDEHVAPLRRGGVVEVSEDGEQVRQGSTFDETLGVLEAIRQELRTHR